MKSLFITGFMATGKSRIGGLVADRLGVRFVDTDHLVVERAGKSVSDIFSQDGEAAFRALELQVLQEVAQMPSCVVALGGGTLTQPEALALVRKSGLVARLWATPEVLNERIGRKNTRPLLAGLDDSERLSRIKELLIQREVYYSQADFSVESSNAHTVEHVAERVIACYKVWSMKSVIVQTAAGERYPILIGENWLDRFDALLEGLRLSGSHEFLACTDTTVAQKQNHNLTLIRDRAGRCRTFQFQAGETAKNLSSLNQLYTFMLRREFGRRTCLLQFGGGVVGDMAGFGAATYQRGIPFIQIPTTLLAMVDSSVGGKVAVNHPEGKNMIGAFYQPKAVAIDLSVLQTLPLEEYRAGLAEIAKYGVIYDKDFFAWMESNIDSINSRERNSLSHMISRSCEIKAEVVSIDEKETGLRAILNYGHTFGHAIEKITDYRKFSHGIAVGLGMRVAGRLATLTQRWSQEEELRQTNLLNALGIPDRFTVDPDSAWKAMGVDKKVEKAKRVYILPTAIGTVEKATDVDQELVRQAWGAIA